MKCVRISISNMDELLNNKYIENNNSALDLCDNIKVNFVQSFTKYKNIIDLACSRYDILFENMMILKINNDCKRRITRTRGQRRRWIEHEGTILNRITDFKSKITKRDQLYIFNKENMTSLVGHKLDDEENINSYHIALLQYFCRDSQITYNIQYLLIDENVTPLDIENYIANDLTQKKITKING